MVKNQPANAGEFDIWVGKVPQKSKRQPTPVLVPGKSQGQKSLAGHSSQGHKESDITEHTHAIVPLTEYLVVIVLLSTQYIVSQDSVEYLVVMTI